MSTKIKQNLILVTSNFHFKIAVQIVILALILLTALLNPDAALAGPSWGSMGG